MKRILVLGTRTNWIEESRKISVDFLEGIITFDDCQKKRTELSRSFTFEVDVIGLFMPDFMRVGYGLSWNKYSLS